MLLPDALIVVDILARRLEALGIAYFVGGSVASSMYGDYRSTNDADIVAAIREDQVDVLVRSLEDEFYIDGDMIRQAIQHRSSFNVIHLPTTVKADLFLPEPTPFVKSEWRRRRLERIRPDEEIEAIYVASPEDMILQKLHWYRLTGERSDRQWRDVQGVLKVQAKALDFGYLRYWAEELELMELLESSLKDAGLESSLAA